MAQTGLTRFQDIPNVGVAIEEKLFELGLSKPDDLLGKDPYKLYDDLCTVTGKKHDPCLIDVFISAVRYVEGGPVKKWWEFTQERKRHIQSNL